MSEPSDVESSIERLHTHMRLRGLRPNTMGTFAGRASRTVYLSALRCLLATTLGDASRDCLDADEITEAACLDPTLPWPALLLALTGIDAGATTWCSRHTRTRPQ